MINRPNTSLTQSITGRVERKFADSRRVVGADLVGGAEVLRDVGAPEPVDRLLRVADDEQPPGERLQLAPRVAARTARHRLCGVVGGGGEPDGDLELDRVGVLELVEQDPDVPLVQEPPDVGVVGEQPASEHEQVVELELARTLARSVAASSTKRPMTAPSSTRRCRLTCSSRSFASRPSSTLVGAELLRARRRRPARTLRSTCPLRREASCVRPSARTCRRAQRPLRVGSAGSRR